MPLAMPGYGSMGRQMFQEPDDSGANLAQPMALGDPEDKPGKA